MALGEICKSGTFAKQYLAGRKDTYLRKFIPFQLAQDFFYGKKLRSQDFTDVCVAVNFIIMLLNFRKRPFRLRFLSKSAAQLEFRNQIATQNESSIVMTSSVQASIFADNCINLVILISLHSATIQLSDINFLQSRLVIRVKLYLASGEFSWNCQIPINLMSQRKRNP